MNFSQRIGVVPATRPFQRDTMDDDLRTALWNAFQLCIVPSVVEARQQNVRASSRSGVPAAVLIPLWVEVLKWPLDGMSDNPLVALKEVTKWFRDKKQAPWNSVYEFVECVGNLDDPMKSEAALFVSRCNRVLEQEFSAYRFVGTTLAPITNDAEIAAIEEAASTDNSLLGPVSIHIESALKLLSDRQNPDYRNSMKESISAVEALCKIIAQNDKATLGPALDVVKGKTDLHPKLQEGFKALYGYTSDTHGIRHALKDDAEPEFEDAKFMLVSCSAFVNYLIEKARKNDLLPE